MSVSLWQERRRCSGSGILHPDKDGRDNFLPCWTGCQKRYQVFGKWLETLWKRRKTSKHWCLWDWSPSLSSWRLEPCSFFLMLCVTSSEMFTTAWCWMVGLVGLVRVGFVWFCFFVWFCLVFGFVCLFVWFGFGFVWFCFFVWFCVFLFGFVCLFFCLVWFGFSSFCLVWFGFVLFVLFCFVSFRFVCFILFCFVSFCFVLFCFVVLFVLFCFVSFRFVLFVLFCFVLFCLLVCLLVCLFVLFGVLPIVSWTLFQVYGKSVPFPSMLFRWRRASLKMVLPILGPTCELGSFAGIIPVFAHGLPAS